MVFFVVRTKSNSQLQATENEIYQEDSISIKKWMNSKELYTNSEIIQAKNLLFDSLKISIHDSAHVKLEKIAGFLIAAFYQQLGTPDLSLREYSPWQQYQLLRSDTTRDLYCTHFSTMLAFFGRVGGLSVREVECKGVNDLHIFNEVYFPENKKWVYSDLTHGITYLTHNGIPLNSVEVMKWIQEHKSDTLEQVRIEQLPFKPYRELKTSLLFNFDTNCALFFYQTANLDIQRKLFLIQQTPLVLIYSNQIVHSKWMYLQIVSGFCVLLSFFFCWRFMQKS